MWLIKTLLNPLFDEVHAHLSNTFDIIERLQALDSNTVEAHPYIFSLDVESMYTSIPPDEAISNAMDYLRDKKFSYHGLVPNDIKDLLSLIFQNMYFTYNGVLYRQKQGLPMGASVSGLLAIIS